LAFIPARTVSPSGNSPNTTDIPSLAIKKLERDRHLIEIDDTTRFKARLCVEELWKWTWWLGALGNSLDKAEEI
jgi:hypothetical protein